jgi:hypothetical protein
MDDILQLGFQLHAFSSVQVALENRKLQVIAIVLVEAKYPSQPFGVGNIMTCNVGVSYRLVPFSIRIAGRLSRFNLLSAAELRAGLAR